MSELCCPLYLNAGQDNLNSPLTLLTYMLKEPYLSFDALSYNATLKAEVCLSESNGDVSYSSRSP